MAIQPTQVSPTHQQGSRGYLVDHVVLHHCASTDFDGVVRMMTSGSRQVSANYVVKDKRIASVVPENMRSWSLSSALWDGRSITFEICNESIGGSWPVSSASHETVAQMVADICGRYGIPINRDRILGHREVYTRHGASYATSCPGGLNMDWIVARAAQIAAGGSSNEEDDPMVIITGNQSKGEYFCLYDPVLNMRTAKLNPVQLDIVSKTNLTRYEMPQKQFDAIPYGLEAARRVVPGGSGGGSYDDTGLRQAIANLSKQVSELKVAPTKATVSLS